MPDADPSSPEPIDPFDPRFADAGEEDRPPQRRLVRSRGPGPSLEDPLVRLLRFALPLVFFAGIGVVVMVFVTGLRPGPQSAVLGHERAVREAVAQRPKRVCFNGNNPCAWITVVDHRLTAFNTNGPLPQEYGRAGVGWCASSGWFGANATGSRFDQRGQVARGPAPRGLDRFGLRVDDAGVVHIHFTELTTGRAAALVDEVTDPDGPHCDTIPFDRDADLPRLDS